MAITTDGSAITVAASGRKFATKDPQGTLDYSFYWKDWLAEIGCNISTLTASVVNPAGIDRPLTITSQTHFDGVATIFVSGGTVGKTHQLTCRITTDSVPPRIDERSLFIKIKER